MREPKRVTLLFEPRDLWIGIFWDRRWLPLMHKDRKSVVLYFCVIPTIVLRVVL
jgi:hypothetical protein